MNDHKVTVGYLGFQALSDGSRRLDFSFYSADTSLRFISVEASRDLFSGPDHMGIQECASICYEILKCRVTGYSGTVPGSISLTTADVAEHKKSLKTPGPCPTAE